MKSKFYFSLLIEIDKAKNSDALIVVEGCKDKKALEKLGFKSKNIIILHGRPFYVTVEKIKTKECIILTDFDKKGKHLYHSLKKELVKKGVRINNRLRIILLKNKISHIEGLATFIYNKLHKKD